MPKSLTCKRCSTNLGEMEKGKIRKDAVLVCEKCYDKLRIAEADKRTDSAKSYPDFFGDFFKGVK